MTDFSLDTVRLDAESKRQLSKLKTRTKIPNWNVLCRWAFCLSISDSAPPRDIRDRGGTAIEMTWKTFAGEDDQVYRLMLIERCRQDFGKTDRETLAAALRQHLARGISRLAAGRQIKSIQTLLATAIGKNGSDAVDATEPGPFAAP